MIILNCIDKEKIGGAAAKMLVCEVRDHGFDTHQCTTGKWNSKPPIKGMSDFEFLTRHHRMRTSVHFATIS
ncbi:unnamed protein product [Hymenolepis diminuta]|uniref:Uncharacterized protein n=1 Tax=Hymenolepis diminuta TaxID=6216 RepID=A0A564YU21_HYMDI|nr:unnamed protein product [Hymenolepis diminuta]